MRNVVDWPKKLLISPSRVTVSLAQLWILGGECLWLIWLLLALSRPKRTGTEKVSSRR